MEIKTVKEKDMPKRVFMFSQEFPNEVELALKAYDRVFKELTSISSGKITFPEEYGVVNNLYKFRYISPNDIATYTSNLIKVLKGRMIQPQVTDLEKFSVLSVKHFIEDHDCVPIEHSSIYGLYHYTTNHMTLRDLLVLCENDFYHRTVVSKFEMEQRVKVMQKDYQKLVDLHFTTNTMKIVDSLPKLMEQTEFNGLSYAERKAVQTYVEEFILFAIMLNTVIMSNMIFFCVPRSTYDTKYIVKKPKYDTNDLLSDDLDADSDDESVVTESVNRKDTKPIYIVLGEGQKTFVVDQIKSHTRSRYAHASISFDDSLHHVYSYGLTNEVTEESPLKKGFCIEDLSTDMKKDTSVSIYVGFVSQENFDKLQKEVEDYKEHKTKYSIKLILDGLFHNDHERKGMNTDKKYKQVCSSFVDTLLKSANIHVTKKNRPSPGDIEKSVSEDMVHFERVFTGTFENYDVKDVRKRVAQFAKSKNTEQLDVVTECCLLKTGHTRHMAKIPFDINMRNIVLQDMHPKFKDTVSAIEFITHDTRSPIAQMLFRYGHPSEVLNGIDGMMICQMFIGNGCPCYQCGSYDEYNHKLHEIDFHTDVNWLDKIAYGNSFMDGNYRAEDAMGNEHKHPIKQTLEMLYRMFGECKLKTKEELCDHIIKIAHIMKSIIEIYGGAGIHNWEMVRDILAVLGEIMTRSMIKLYDNHMSLIVSDNMDDVDAPGYMYTEAATASSLVRQDF